MPNPSQLVSQATIRWRVAATIFVAVVVCKLLPYFVEGAPYSVTPLFAAGLFFAALFPLKEAHVALPLLTLVFFAVDIPVAWLSKSPLFYHGQAFNLAIVYLCSHWGWGLRHWRNPLSIAATGALACTTFCLLTNTAIWTEGMLYQRNWAGLRDCFMNAWPFYRNLLLSTAGFSALLFHPALVRLVAEIPRDVPAAASLPSNSPF